MADHQGQMPRKKPRIGIALGSGSARGWAHIGVLRELADMGIQPEIVAGCSIGSVVGAAYAADNVDRLEKQIISLTKLEMVRFFELNAAFNGFVRKDRLQQFFHEHVCAELQTVEGLGRKFATVATCLNSGREIWFTEGKVMDAVMASIALPGLFPPFAYQEQWLVDGGLVNPVPVSLCRALGADIVIAVNLNGSVTRRPFANKKQATVDKLDKAEAAEMVDNKPESEAAPARLLSNVAASLKGYSAALFPNKGSNNVPSLVDAITGSINIMQDKITRSRMAGDPPEILLSPKLADIGLLEFYRAQEAIAAGRECVQRMRHEIEAQLT